MNTLRYHDYYYLGPYARVANRDTDLPRRTEGVVIPPEAQARVEFSGILNGERFVAPFNDANGLEEILGCLHVAEGYPDFWDEDEAWNYPTIQGCLLEAEDRIKSRIAHSRASSKRTSFASALERIGEARMHFARGEYSAGQDAVSEASELLQRGNKAHRRGSRFVVAPDGGITPAE